MSHSIPYEQFHKNIWMNFFVQTNESVWKKQLLKLYIFWNVQKIELKPMCQKSISCISQNIKWNENIYPKNNTKMYQNIMHFFPESPPSQIMCFHPIIKGNSIWRTKRTLSLGYTAKLFAPWQEGCVELWDMIMRHFMITFHSHQLHKPKQKGG